MRQWRSFCARRKKTTKGAHPAPSSQCTPPHPPAYTTCNVYVHISLSVLQSRVSAVHRLPALLTAPPPSPMPRRRASPPPRRWRRCPSRCTRAHDHHGPDTGRNLRAGNIHHIRHRCGDRLSFLIPASGHVVAVRVTFGMVKRPCKQIRTQHLGMLIFQCLIDWYAVHMYHK